MAWTSSIETIYHCPVVKGTRGIIRISPTILRMLAGAVTSEKNEWLVVLLGKSELDGLQTTVDDIYTPEDQDRDYGSCDIDEQKYPFPLEVKRRMLGYLHSHHMMEAQFSSVDTGIGGLNQRGAISIVISSSVPMKGPMKTFAKLVGFSYSAVVRHKLPCGAWGKSYADIIPTGVNNWPLAKEVVRSLTTLQVKDLGDCSRHREARESDDYQIMRKGNCGCLETESQTRSLIFGADGSEIMTKLPRPYFKPYVVEASVPLPPPGQTLGYDDEVADEASWREYLEKKYGKYALEEALVRVTD